MAYKLKILLLVIVTLALADLVQCLPNLQITVSTGKMYYSVEEDILVYGDVKNSGIPVENATVALEIRDPSASPITLRTLSTNSLGGYSFSFRLPPEASGGTYSIHVSCTQGGETATGTAWFLVQKSSLFALAIAVGRTSYMADETVEAFGNATAGGAPIGGVLVALEVQDPSGTPIVVRAVGTGADGTYGISFRLPPSSPLGVYTVYSSATYESQSASVNATFEVKNMTTRLADINKDGAVNILDIAIVANAWNSKPGDPRWDGRCDLNNDYIINILDITLVAMEWGQ